MNRWLLARRGALTIPHHRLKEFFWERVVDRALGEVRYPQATTKQHRSTAKESNTVLSVGRRGATQSRRRRRPERHLLLPSKLLEGEQHE
jgi:hypothetical protein